MRASYATGPSPWTMRCWRSATRRRWSPGWAMSPCCCRWRGWMCW